MTEAKSPREIAEQLWIDLKLNMNWEAWRTALIESAILSYAAERERLLAEAVEQLQTLHRCARRCDIETANEEYELVRSSRLSSRPATEGKGDD